MKNFSPRNYGKFSAHNTLCDCRCCGKRTHSSVSGNVGIELCPLCFDSAGQFNVCSDNHNHGVDGDPDADCVFYVRSTDCWHNEHDAQELHRGYKRMEKRILAEYTKTQAS